ncbi:MAG TPA: substrate-binding domain-containing protein, partial [Syntrophorhabdaceae bacterium]|nr:substrate-binding domain-containing protein [Syntrophorhabdaceae bacterium]
PPSDPAKIKGIKSTVEAFKKIAQSKSLFISRSDNSGTHAKEKAIWKAANIKPGGEKWYHETGLGMGQTLNVASEKRAYTLTDRGTYLALKKRLELEMLSYGDKMLFNIYHVIVVNPERFPKVNASGARAFSDFMVSNEAQSIIKTFGIAKFGAPLFFPDAVK